MKSFRLTSIGIVVTALLASACCWLPLLLATFGLSALGLSSFFVGARPWLLVLTAVLLLAALYFRFRRSPGGLLRSPWLLLLIVVGLILFLPQWMARSSTDSELSASARHWSLSLPQEANPSAASAALEASFPGLQVESLGEESGSTLLLTLVPHAKDELESFSPTALASTLPQTSASDLTPLTWRAFPVEGMTCDACTIHVSKALQALPDVLKTSVRFEDETATLLVRPDFQEADALDAVAQVGYRLVPIENP